MTAFALILIARVCVLALVLVAAVPNSGLAQPAARSYQGGEVVSEPRYNPQVEQLHVQGRLIGRELYDRTGQKIGTVRNLLRAPGGVIEGVLVDVGGFLELGDKTIAIPATQIESRNNQLVTADLTRHGAQELPSYPR